MTRIRKNVRRRNWANVIVTLQPNPYFSKENVEKRRRAAEKAKRREESRMVCPANTDKSFPHPTWEGKSALLRGEIQRSDWIEIRPSEDGQWYYRISSANGKVLLTSEMYCKSMTALDQAVSYASRHCKPSCYRWKLSDTMWYRINTYQRNTTRSIKRLALMKMICGGEFTPQTMKIAV